MGRGSVSHFNIGTTFSLNSNEKGVRTNFQSPDFTEALEVLLAHRAVFVKKPCKGAKGTRTGQVSWAKSGGVEAAWAKAKLNAGVS